MSQPPIIVFDTDCVLCSGVVAFILRREKEPLFHFAGAWSPEGLALADAHGFSRDDLHRTFLVITDGRALTRSDAGLIVFGHLRAPWSWLRFLTLVPRPLRDSVYSVVADRRYRWFGQRKDCVVVPADQRHRFMGVAQPDTASAAQSPGLDEPAGGPE